MTGEPLINTAGHAAGVFLFGNLLYLIARSGARPSDRRLPVACAAAAFLWNLLSLAGIVLGRPGGWTYDALAAASFSVLSLLPAFLMHLSVPRFRSAVLAGYGLSALALLAHAAELLNDSPRLHRLGLDTITVGFGVLTVLAALRLVLRGSESASTPRLLATMSLFLFAVSFVHFGEGHTAEAWSQELAFHHAGIPLALFVLLQDWRFLMLDAFVRLVANGILAVLFALAVSALRPADPVLQIGVLTVGFAGYAAMRPVLQRALTRLVFRQPDPDRALALLPAVGPEAREETYSESSLDAVAGLMKAPSLGWRAAGEQGPLVAVLAEPHHGVEPAQVILPVRLSNGETRWALLGERRGRQPYLSEDLALLTRLGSAIAARIEQIRHGEVHRLVTEAELRALQTQIHPHFLFNALNTLYGVIPKEAAAARRLLLNLSDVFRYSLRAGRGMATVEEELDAVRAYLAIESARWGEKLHVEINADPGSMSHRIPALSIQPLVENAIKHGVSANPDGGWVKVQIARAGEVIRIVVADSGRGAAASESAAGSGVGLENVRRRLHLCYGAAGTLTTQYGVDGSTVAFQVPVAA